MIAGMVTKAEVAVTRAGDHFEVKASRYEATFDRKGALLALKVEGEDYMARLPDLPASYFYRAAIIMPDEAQESGNTLSAKGNGVEWRWEFLDNELLLHALNSRRQPMRLFLLFSSSIEAVSLGGEDRFSVPHKHDGAGSVTFHRSGAALELSGGMELMAFRGQQVYGLELASGMGAVLRFNIQ